MEWKLKSKTDDMTVYTCFDGRYELKCMHLDTINKDIWEIKDTLTHVKAYTQGMYTAFDDLRLYVECETTVIQMTRKDLQEFMAREASNNGIPQMA